MYCAQVEALENDANKALDGEEYFELLEKLSVQLQLKVSEIIKHLSFNPANSNKSLVAAIEHYKEKDGYIGELAPVSFVTTDEQSYLIDDKGKIKKSLYKALLFWHSAEAIKSGEINLSYSYRYLSVEEYLIKKKSSGFLQGFLPTPSLPTPLVGP